MRWGDAYILPERHVVHCPDHEVAWVVVTARPKGCWLCGKPGSQGGLPTTLTHAQDPWPQEARWLAANWPNPPSTCEPT